MVEHHHLDGKVYKIKLNNMEIQYTITPEPTPFPTPLPPELPNQE